MNLVALLVGLLVFCVLVWAARYLLTAFEMPAQIQAVVTVVIVIVFVLWVASQLTGFGPEFRLR